jgi:hypothetical protein
VLLFALLLGLEQAVLEELLVQELVQELVLEELLVQEPVLEVYMQHI